MKLKKNLTPLHNTSSKKFKGPFKQNFNFEMFKLCLGDKKIHFLKKDIFSNKFKFRYLSNTESEIVFQKIKDFLKKEIIKSGTKRKKVWELGWGKNLKSFNFDSKIKNLIPNYYRRGPKVMRYQGKHIIPKNNMFEYKLSKIILKYIDRKYLRTIKNIYEFGCGPGHNLINLAKISKSQRTFVGVDWAKSSQKIIKIIEKRKKKLRLEKHSFISGRINMISKINNYYIRNNSACLTFGSMEQLGKKFRNFYNFIIKQPFKVYINIEPINELYSRLKVFDDLSHRDHIKRGYLKNYLTFLKKKNREKKIKILKIHKIIGSEMDDGWTLVVWKKNKDFKHKIV